MRVNSCCFSGVWSDPCFEVHVVNMDSVKPAVEQDRRERGREIARLRRNRTVKMGGNHEKIGNQP